MPPGAKKVIIELSVKEWMYKRDDIVINNPAFNRISPVTVYVKTGEDNSDVIRLNYIEASKFDGWSIAIDTFSWDGELEIFDGARALLYRDIRIIVLHFTPDSP